MTNTRLWEGGCSNRCKGNISLTRCLSDTTALRPKQTHHRAHRPRLVVAPTILSSAAILPDPARMNAGEVRSLWWRWRRRGHYLPAEVGLILILGGRS